MKHFSEIVSFLCAPPPPFKQLSHLTGIQYTWNERYAIRGHPPVVFFSIGKKQHAWSAKLCGVSGSNVP